MQHIELWSPLPTLYVPGIRQAISISFFSRTMHLSFQFRFTPSGVVTLDAASTLLLRGIRASAPFSIRVPVLE
jgi:hypothetical protein